MGFPHLSIFFIPGVAPGPLFDGFQDLVGADTTPALLTMSELSKAPGAIASGIATGRLGCRSSDLPK